MAQQDVTAYSQLKHAWQSENGDLQILPWRILRNRRPMWIWKVGCHKNESNFHIIFSPCGPHGTCESTPTDLSPLEFKCVCQDGYLGSRCDIETNECIPGMYEIFDLIRFWNNATFSTRKPQTCKFLSHTNCLSEEYFARYSSSYIAWFGMMKILFKEKKTFAYQFFIKNTASDELKIFKPSTPFRSLSKRRDVCWWVPVVYLPLRRRQYW